MCGYLRQTTGLRPALRATALTCATAACLTIPFYLYDRPNFGPIEGANRLLVFSDLLPHLGLALMVLMAVLAFVLSFSPMDAPALFRNCALVQALPVVAGVVLSTVQDRQLNLWYARYGPFFSWFALIALAAALSNSRAACRASDTRLPFWRLNLNRYTPKAITKSRIFSSSSARHVARLVADEPVEHLRADRIGHVCQYPGARLKPL
jgi:hypothetical protein